MFTLSTHRLYAEGSVNQRMIIKNPADGVPLITVNTFNVIVMSVHMIFSDFAPRPLIELIYYTHTLLDLVDVLAQGDQRSFSTTPAISDIVINSHIIILIK